MSLAHRLDSAVSAVLPTVIRLRHCLHAHPELGYHEEKTRRTLVELLRRLPNLRIRRRGQSTGIVADLCAWRKGSCLAFRADMDALPITEESSLPYASTVPGVMHACGHDGHMACLVGTAMVLSRLSECLAGPVRFIFQPAEEHGGGAVRMCQEGALEDPVPEMVFGMHGWPGLPLDHVAICRGPAMAANANLRIVIRGRACHAAFPRSGINPIPIGGLIADRVRLVSRPNAAPRTAAVVSVTTFHSGETWNVIPDQAVLTGTLRAFSVLRIRELVRQIRSIARRAARSTGAQASVEVVPLYPPVINAPAPYGLFLNTARALLGASRVHDRFPPSLGSEDFAHYGLKIPAAYWFLGLGGKRSPSGGRLHHGRFDFDDRAIATAIRLNCGLALALHHGASHVLRHTPINSPNSPR